MSLKNCVVCIAGDIKQDMFAPASWEDANIEKWFRLRDMTLFWNDMNKTVTHLVVSRAAFRSRHAAVKYVENDKRKDKAKIVTYDWLEDSFAAAKAIQDVSAYDPGKPRDIDAMLAACRKSRKTAKSFSANETRPPAKEAVLEKDRHFQAIDFKPQNQVQPKASSSSKVKVVAMARASGSAVAQPSAFKRQPALSKSVISENHLIPASNDRAQIQKTNELENPRVQANPAVVANAGVSLSWEATHKPRVFHDKTDQFKYHINLEHKEKPGERWVLVLLETPDVVDKAFLFRAYQYNGKNKIDLREDKTPPSNFQKAFEMFTTSFHSKMRYPWDERLVVACDVRPGKWRYRLPAKGEPTGKVPPEFDPCHPQYIKPKNLPPIGRADPGQRVVEESVSESSYERRPITLGDRLIYKKASKPSGICTMAQKGKMKAFYRSKVRKSAAPNSLKRRAEEYPGPERRSKIVKPRNAKFKSLEFIAISDSDDDLPRSSQHKPGPENCTLAPLRESDGESTSKLSNEICGKKSDCKIQQARKGAAPCS